MWEMSNSRTDVSRVGHRYRMIAIDLDGTLLTPRGHVSPRTVAAVHRVLSAGIEVCFATGRNWTESEFVLEAVGHYPTSVFVGGAMVVDTKRRKTLHRTIMQPALAAEVCGFFENRGHATLALQDTSAAGVDYLISDVVAIEAPTTIWMEVSKAKIHRVPNLEHYPHEHTIRVGIVAKREETSRLRPELEKQFGKRIVFHSIAVMSFGVDVLEVFDPAVNKWQGLLHVAAEHKINPQDIIAVGDDVNDIPMIANAGLGVAMGNARPELKAVARRIIGSNSEDGLARFLEELVIKHAVESL
jgi:Cof subfamily protein (haloacid dehalogenase superfamily)